MQRVGLAIFSMVVWAPTVFAEQSRLKNGDRLSGTIVISDAKTLVVKTEYADAITAK